MFTKAQYYLTSEQRHNELNQTSPVMRAVGQFEIDKISVISGRTKERLMIADSRLQERIALNDSLTYTGSNYGHARKFSSPAVRGNIFTRKGSVISAASSKSPKISGSSRTRVKGSSPAISASSAKEKEALA